MDAGAAGRMLYGVGLHGAKCFLFSSRRRHTRLQGDWSSDVCSSDLVLIISAGKATKLPIGNFLNPLIASDTNA